MLSENDIRQLIAPPRTETKNLDYKRGINWGRASRDDKLEIVRDILAMANTPGGGQIVFGVTDEKHDLEGMSSDEVESFDQTRVNDQVHKYADPKHSCQIYKHVEDGNNFVVIETPEFEEIPIICKADAHSSVDNSKQILRKGQIYVRTDKATTEALSSSEQWRELFERAQAKKGGTSDDTKDKYGAEIGEAESFFSEHIGKELGKHGYWMIQAYPTRYDPKRIENQKAIGELIQRSKVDLRSWPFPLTDPQNAVNFAKGRQSYTIWNRSVEAYRAYKSGLFIARRAFWEDVEGHRCQDQKRVLSFESAIPLVTEIFLFLKCYYEETALQGDVHIKIVLNGTKNRSLTSFSRSFIPRGDYVAHDDLIHIIDEDIKVVDLRASYKDIAYRVIKDAFLAFNWEWSEEHIRQGQAKLLKGKV